MNIKISVKQLLKGTQPGRGLCHPPTVKGVPLIGNLLQFKERPRDFFVDCNKKYGSIYRIKGFHQDLVVISGEHAQTLAAQDESNGLHRRDIFNAFSTEAGVDIFGVQGEQQARLRSLLKLGYSRAITAQFMPEMSEVIKTHIADWKQHSTLNLFEECYKLSLLSMMKVVTPMDLSHLVDDFFFFGDTAMYVVTKGRPPAWLKNPLYQKARAKVYAGVNEAIERHRSGEWSEHAKMYMIDAFLQSTNDCGDRMDTRAVRGGALYALCGTFVYIGRIIAFMLYELLRNQHLLKEIRTELHAAFWKREIDPQLFRRLPHLRGAYYETLRMYPLLPGLPFAAEQDMEIGGFYIPKGQLILLTGIPGHFSHKAYNNPQVFDAKRCMAPRSEHRRKGAFCPFGMGKRTCMATGLVEIITLTTVTHILRQTELGLVQPTFRMELTPAPLLAPKQELLVTVENKIDPDKDDLVENVSSLKHDLSESSDLGSQSRVEELFDRLPELQTASFRAGEWLITSQSQTDKLFVLVDGFVTLTKHVRTKETRTKTTSTCLGPGNSFGEEGLLKQVSRTYQAQAKTDVLVLSLDRHTFIQLLEDTDLLGKELGAMLQQRYMSRIFAKAMPQLTREQLLKCSEKLSIEFYKSGEEIYVQGHPSTAFYVIASGLVEAIHTNERGEANSSFKIAGESFGELGILQQKPRHATVLAKEDTTLLQLGRKAFIDILSESAKAREDVALTICRHILRQVTDSHPENPLQDS